MERLLSFLRRHWDDEPWNAPASRTHSKRCAKSQALGHRAAAFGVRGACSRFRTRFMESLLSLLRMHWDHEPTPNPSREGNGQDADRRLFPSWAGSGVGRFMERLAGANLGTGWVGWLHCRMACMDGAALFRPGIHIAWQTALRLATRQ